MAVVRATIGDKEDFATPDLFDALIPRDNLTPYVATYVDKDGTRRTPGIWLAIITDPEWGRKNDEGTIIETYVGVEEQKPWCHGEAAFLRRFFVVQGLPTDLRPKLHKLPVALPDDVLSKTGVFVNTTETVKGKAELTPRVAIAEAPLEEGK